MFDELSEKVSGVFSKLRGRGVLSDSDIKEGLREMRRVLLEADVSFQLTRVNERWSIYIVQGTSPARDLQGSKLDEKLLFLEKADEFEAEYIQRIRDLYETLKELAQDQE